MTAFTVRLTVKATIDADTEAEAAEFLRYRVEEAARVQERSWGTPHNGPLFEIDKT